MVERRDYLCFTCGKLMFRARGSSSSVEVVLPCKRCKTMNTLSPGVPQAITSTMLANWERWRTRSQPPPATLLVPA